ncbi:hypothetical protein DB345_17285 [Spartobacteria bacterium LR76]|nr:hypothetical protein DB345_17285 [Spartobacteria bacterium LR76]
MSSKKPDFASLRREIEDASVTAEMMTHHIDAMKESFSKFCDLLREAPYENRPSFLTPEALDSLEKGLHEGVEKISVRSKELAASIESSMLPVIAAFEDLYEMVERLERKQGEGDEWKDTDAPEEDF